MKTLRNKVLSFALYTRAFILILQLVCNCVIPDHDAGVFQWPEDPDLEPSPADKLTGFLLDGLVRWGGQHFLHIAQHGYTYESNLAFFPLYPLTVRTLASALHWLQADYQIIHFYSLLKISAILLSNVFFVLATHELYDLSRRVLKDEYLAYKAALFFAINPASIFFSAPYSESLNALLTFFALAKFTKAFSSKSCVAVCLASATRSNSIINLGFVVYHSLKIVATETILFVRTKKMAKDKAEMSTTIANILGDALIPGLFNLVGCVVSFIAFQYFCFTNFCRVTQNKQAELGSYVIQYGRDNLLKVVGDDPSDWCQYEPPVAYGYVQKVYWNNGFLNYWEVKQLPNFLVALPAVMMILWHSYEFVRVHWDYVKRLGLVDNNLLGIPRRACRQVREYQVLPRECFVYVVHATALTVFAVLFMHVQVVTRLLMAGSPVLPWLAAIMTTRLGREPVPLCEDDNLEIIRKIECRSNLRSNTDTILFQENLETDKAQWTMMYFLGYTLVGTILFSNNLPWT